MAVSLFARMRVEVMLAVAGCAHALTFAPDPLPYWSLAIIQVLTLAILVHSVRDADSVRLAALRGWWFGLVSFSVGLYWLFISMNHYGGLPAPLAAVGVVGLSAFLALFTGFSCGLFVWLRPVSVRGKVWLDVLTWSSVWAGAEWLRSILFSGFPWLNIGYAHVDSALAGWAPLLGVHGVAFFAAFVAAALSILLRPSAAQQKSTVSVVIIAFTLLFAGQLLMRVDWSSAHGKPLNIRLVQGNIEQSQKFDPNLFERGLIRHLQLAAKPPALGEPSADLIVLPETVLPVFQDQLDDTVWEAWRDVAVSQQSAIAMGAPLRTTNPHGAVTYTNSAIGFDSRTTVQQLTSGTMPQRYDKRHLVPWGEYTPPGFKWFVQMLNLPMGEFDRGPVPQTPFEVEDQNVAFNICYENVFGPELLPALSPQGGQDPGASILINISNLAWFGPTWALRQHLQIGRLRSIETARPMVTSTNTGMTASIDHHGKVMAILEPHRAGVLAVTVQGMSGLTPYARFGDATVLVLTGMLILVAVRVRPRIISHR